MQEPWIRMDLGTLDPDPDSDFHQIAFIQISDCCRSCEEDPSGKWTLLLLLLRCTLQPDRHNSWFLTTNDVQLFSNGIFFLVVISFQSMPILSSASFKLLLMTLFQLCRFQHCYTGAKSTTNQLRTCNGLGLRPSVSVISKMCLGVLIMLDCL